MTQEPDHPAALRSRTRRAVRAEITAVAMRLFLDRGFDAVTMEQVATETGLSRRSLFRYFNSKEDIVLGDLVDAGVIVKEALEQRPAEEPPWQALRAALESLAAEPQRSAERTLAVSRMLASTPSLRARHLEKRMRWQELLVPELHRRLRALADGEVPVLHAEAVVACALTCLDVASQAWTSREGADDLAELFDEAAAAVGTALPAGPPRRPT